MINTEKQNSNYADPLELNDNTARKIFGHNFFISGYKEGRIFFKKIDPDNADKLAVLYFGTLIFIMLTLNGSLLLKFIALLIYAVYALNVFKTENYIVLDYYKNVFYLETHNLFHQKKVELFPFSKIQDISTIYEERKIPSRYGGRGEKKYTTIIIGSVIFLLSNNQSYRFISHVDYYFEKLEFIASKLAVVLKKNYLDNTNKLPLSVELSGGESRFKALLPGEHTRLSFWTGKENDSKGINPFLGGIIIFIGSIIVIFLLLKYMFM